MRLDKLDREQLLETRKDVESHLDNIRAQVEIAPKEGLSRLRSAASRDRKRLFQIDFRLRELDKTNGHRSREAIEAEIENLRLIMEDDKQRMSALKKELRKAVSREA